MLVAKQLSSPDGLSGQEARSGRPWARGSHTPRIDDAGCAMRSYGVPYGHNRRQRAPGSCWIECMLWRTAAKLLKTLLFFWRGSLENRPDRPRVLWRTVDSGPRFSGEPPDSRAHRPVPDRIQRPGRAETRPFLVANRPHSRAGHSPARRERNESFGPDSSR